MSFSFVFTAASKAHAKALLEEQHAPAIVKHVAHTAIDNLRQDKPIRVEANGHLHDGDDYDVSEIKLLVRPISVPIVSSPKTLGGAQERGR